MTDQPVVQVSRLLDERGLSSFQIKLLIWSFFIVLIDGYDIAAIAFAAPHLVKSWGVAPSALGPVFSASLVGILFGSALFGWVGDRFGRKAALVTSNLLFGVFTLAAAYSTNLDQMFWLRLLAGLGIGGVIPNVVAINTESAPRNLRATLAIIAVGCVPIGGAIPGFVTAVFVAQYGWPILFLIGGIVPIVIEGRYQVLLGTLANVWSTERAYCPAIISLVSNQSANADDGVVDVLWEFVSHRGADIVFAIAVMVIGSGESFKVRYRFDIPNDDACAHDRHFIGRNF